MSPPMTYRLADHLRRRRPIAILAELEHPDGTARFWTGIGKLYWRGQTWTGSGQLGRITPIKQTSAIVIQEIQFQMSGVDPDTVSKLNDDVRNLAGRVWLAGIWKRDVVTDPYLILESQLDYQQFDVDEDGNAVLSITARSGFYTLERNIDEAWTTEEQKKLYPDDTGLDLIPGLQNQDIIWSPT